MLSNKPCPTCSAQNPAIAKFCRFCGSRFPEETPAASKPAAPVEQTPADSASPAVQENPKPALDESDIIALGEIREKLSMFINTLVIRRRQKKIGMNVSEQTFVLVFRGETGTGKSLVADYFISNLQKSGCLSSNKIERTTAHKLKRLYQYDADISRHVAEQKPGVLLVDEIHEDEGYLHELLLGLTEKPSETICILLGIKEPLERFFSEKSELSDLVRFYDFPNLSDENLVKILAKKLRNGGFDFDENISDSFSPCVQEARQNTVYQNGWICEKEIIPQILEKQASRLSRLPHISESDLKRITAEDLPVRAKHKSVEEILSMLDELIGMNEVKKAVRELAQSIQNNQRRISLGLSAENPKIHIILTGNPGTGKTTVARILGKLFFAMKLLPSDKVLETSGLDLTAGYVGQTKDKVNELCDKAMGGVLFIDEAYYLAGTDGNANSFASEAVGTILKRMEDDRGKFVVIAAGYKDEMQNFLRMNPGLESRFEHKIHIDDYNEEELFEILCLNIKKSQFSFALGAEDAARTAVASLCKNKGKDFANARAVRNLFDTIKTNMDSRLSKFDASSLTRDALTTIEAADIPHEESRPLSAEEVFAELNELIGMEKVKKAVRELYDTVKITRNLKKSDKR